MVETKQFAVNEWKEVSESGKLVGTLSTYGNIDLVGDICEKGCFDRTVKEKGTWRTLLRNHNPDNVIGSLDVVDTKDDLSVELTTDMNVQLARETHSLVKNGHIRGMSIGYNVRDFYYDDDGIRHLTDLDLVEGSIVTFPANERTSVSAKSIRSTLPFKTRSHLVKSSKFKSLSEEERLAILTEVDAALEHALDEVAETEEDEKNAEEDEDDDLEETLTEKFLTAAKEIKKLRMGA